MIGYDQIEEQIHSDFTDDVLLVMQALAFGNILMFFFADAFFVLLRSCCGRDALCLAEPGREPGKEKR